MRIEPIRCRWTCLSNDSCSPASSGHFESPKAQLVGIYSIIGMGVEWLKMIELDGAHELVDARNHTIKCENTLGRQSSCISEFCKSRDIDNDWWTLTDGFDRSWWDEMANIKGANLTSSSITREGNSCCDISRSYTIVWSRGSPSLYCV